MNTITNENVQMLFSLLNKMLDRQEIIIDQLGTLNDTAEITMINTITAGDNDVVNGNILADSLTEESPDQETAYGLEDGFAVEENEVGDGVPELTLWNALNLQQQKMFMICLFKITCRTSGLDQPVITTLQKWQVT